MADEEKMTRSRRERRRTRKTIALKKGGKRKFLLKSERNKLEAEKIIFAARDVKS